MATLDSLFVELGFEIDTTQLEVFEKEMKQARDSVLSITAILAAAAGAIGLFAVKIAENVDALGDFAEEQQVNIETIQELGHAAQINGSSLDAIKTSIEGLNRTTGEAVNGLGRGKKSFEAFGLSAKNADGSVKTFDQLLAEIADKMKGMSRQSAISMASKLGIDKSLIPLLLKGREEIEALRQEARLFGVTSEAEAAQAGALTDSLDRLKFILGSVARGLAFNVIPKITEIFEATRKWIIDNRELINTRLEKWMGLLTIVLSTVWDWVQRIISILQPFVQWLTNSTIGTYLLAGAFAVLIKMAVYKQIFMIVRAFQFLASIITVTNIAALLTTALLGALFIGIGLLIDDFINWREGNDSLIGEMIKKFPVILEIINFIQSGVSEFVSFWMEQWTDLSGPVGELANSILELVSTLWSVAWPVIKMVFRGWAEIAKLVIPIIMSIVKVLTIILVGAIRLVIGVVAGLAKVFAWVFDSATQRVKSLIDLLSYFVKGVKVALGWLGKIPGVSIVANAVQQATQPQGTPTKKQSGVAGFANSRVPTSGVLGSPSAAGGNTEINSTDMSGMQIIVQSPDPGKAGEAVQSKIDEMHRKATRNGQSQVKL